MSDQKAADAGGKPRRNNRGGRRNRRSQEKQADDASGGDDLTTTQAHDIAAKPAPDSFQSTHPRAKVPPPLSTAEASPPSNNNRQKKPPSSASATATTQQDGAAAACFGGAAATIPPCRLPFLGTMPVPTQFKEVICRMHHELSFTKVDEGFLDAARQEGDSLADAALDALLDAGVPIYSLMHLDVGEGQAEEMIKSGYVTKSVLAAAENHAQQQQKQKTTSGQSKQKEGAANKKEETLASAVFRVAETDQRARALIDDMCQSPKEWLKTDAIKDDPLKVIRKAQALFNRNWLPGGLVLGMRSLFLAYLIPDGMEVLKNYGSSLHGPNDFQRLFHTAFWVRQLMLMEEDPLASTTSKPFRSALHVRLMHSGIRKALLTRGVLKNREATPMKARKFAIAGEGDTTAVVDAAVGPGSPSSSSDRMPWDTKRYGVPINQEDMAGTIFLFSVVFLDGLRIMGVSVPFDEAQAYHLYWRLIALRLGVRPDLIPIDVWDASLLAHRVGERRYDVDPSLLEFTDSLVGQTVAVYPITRPVVSALIQRLCGEEVVRDTKLAKPSRGGTLFWALAAWVFWLSDLAQRWIPGLFTLLYFFRDPLRRLSLRKAGQLARAEFNESKEAQAQRRREAGCPF